jgi:ABC-type multidrug transport system ATPase subunit
MGRHRAVLTAVYAPRLYIQLQDEPTTGMDPNTRRHVWNILLAAVKNQQSVVLSSHR